jgi:hypothetical protein
MVLDNPGVYRSIVDRYKNALRKAGGVVHTALGPGSRYALLRAGLDVYRGEDGDDVVAW